LITTMDHGDVGSKVRKKQSIFECGIAAADHSNGDIAVKGAVAGGATRNPAADQFLLGFNSEILRTRARGNDDRLGFNFFAVAQRYRHRAAG